jgi:DNA-binding IclR family transcriptional regulator
MDTEKIQTLDRAFQILDCFSLEDYELGVREVSRMTNLSSSVCGRLMVAMKNWGVLSQNGITKAYTIGPKSLRWAEIYSANLDIRIVALPFINQLLLQSKETISLYILDDDERLCIERMESAQNVRIVARIGRRLPLYAGSAGKVLLAFLPSYKQEEIIRKTEFKPFTENTIIDPQILREDLKVIQNRGYAFSNGEWVADASGVAAPIFDHKGAVVAALTISGPSNRFTASVVQTHIKNVLTSAEQISLELGYIGTNYPQFKQSQ